MANEYILISRTSKRGIMNNSTIYEFTFANAQHDVFMGVVDSSYRNFAKWQHLVSGDVPYGIYSGIHVTNKRNKLGAQVINADFAPQMLNPLQPNEVQIFVDKALGRI